MNINTVEILYPTKYNSLYAFADIVSLTFLCITMYSIIAKKAITTNSKI